MFSSSAHDQLDAFSAGLPATDPQINRARLAVERAKQKGLITTPADQAKPDLEKVRSKIQQHVAPALDKSSGEEAADLVGVKTRWMNVTPQMAGDWLARNVRNRSLSQDVVAAYAREMRDGRWLPIHQGMAFNNRDELIDGQHRLHAIVKSGCTVRMMVTFGLPSRVGNERWVGMDVVDRGRPRTVADQLKIQHGIKHGSVLAMVCTRLAAICTPERTRRLSVAEVLEIWGEFEEAVNFVIEGRSKEHGLKQAGVMAGFAFAIASQAGDAPSTETMKSLYRGLVTGEGIKKGGAVALLREFLTSDEAVLLGRGNDRALAELVLQALWLQSQHRKLERLELGTDGVEWFRQAAGDSVRRVAAMFEFQQKGGLEG